MNYVLRCIGALALATAFTGCATTNNPQDPFEGFNRTMFKFNDKLDQVALKPAATVYRDVLPSFVQIAIGNFFGNIGDVWTSVNNLLQGKVEDGLNDFMRVAVNTTMGFAGILDIGSAAGIQKHREDFGQTLGVWGFKPGPYVVLPFLGSTTVRDTAALPVDFQGDVWGLINPASVRNIGSVVRVIDQRSVVLDASNLLEDAALDRYEFVRDGFLQRRESKVYDGEVPKSKDAENDFKESQQSLMLNSGNSKADKASMSKEPEQQLPVLTSGDADKIDNKEPPAAETLPKLQVQP